MYCHKCGRELPFDAKFCSSCGTSVYKISTEEFKVSSEDLVKTVKKLRHHPKFQTVAILLFGLSVAQTRCVQLNVLAVKNNKQKQSMTVRYDYPKMYYDK